MKRTIIGGFQSEADLLEATRTARESGWQIVDVHTPYAVHGLDEAMGLRPSRLPWVCFAFGLVGALFAMWFQNWAMTTSWPTTAGREPTNLWPAFVPVAFEVMVLLAGFGVAFAFFLRCRLLPGKRANLPLNGITDDRFALVIRATDAASEAWMIRECMYEHHATCVEEHEERGS